MEQNNPSKQNSIQIADFQNKFKNLKISITIYNTQNNKSYNVLSNAKNINSQYTIIYDPDRHASTNLCVNNYYCNSLNDLHTIVSFICNNPEIYTYVPSDDVLDQEDTVSLDDTSLKCSREVAHLLY